MNHMTVDSPDAPWNGENKSPAFECRNCYNVYEYDNTESAMIGHNEFCEYCLNEMDLREWGRPVNEITADLKKSFLNELGQRIWERVCDETHRTVKHI